MKVHFHKVDIEYYKSIIRGTLTYSAGVWHLVGNNNDSFSSNGSGKSTAIEALQQCLFNKTSKGLTIDTATNKQTGKPYNITAYFTGIDGSEYKVNNNRTSMKITIFKQDGEFWVDQALRSTPTALTRIQELIGMDFNTFIALTHVTHSTIVNMVDNFTSSNLMKVILDFGTLQKFDKKLKENLKSSTSESLMVAQKKDQAQSSLKLLGNFKKVDTSETKRAIVKYSSLKTEVLKAKESLISRCQPEIDEFTREINDIRGSIDNNRSKLESTTCYACGSTLEELTPEDKSKIHKELKTQEASMTILQGSLDTALEDYKKSLDSLDTKYQEYQETENRLNTKLGIDEYNNEMYSQAECDINTLHDTIAQCDKELPELYFKQDVYQEAIQKIKSGVLHKELIQNFCSIYNVYINDLLQYVSINDLVIQAIPKKNSLEFQVIDKRFNQEIQMGELSGGELTRVRIVLLLAMLKSVQTLTNTSVNLLVFDEALDTLDASATEDLARLFEYLVQNDDKFIALVSHGSQLSSIDFTGTITVTKTEGVSTIYQEL